MLCFAVLMLFALKIQFLYSKTRGSTVSGTTGLPLEEQEWKPFQCFNVPHIRVGRAGAVVRKVKMVKDEDKKEIIPLQNST
jgi:hypothetical protein